jgi:hypothetical protein
VTETKKRAKKTVKTKHAGGRPPKFDTPEKMQAEIDAYFAHCDARQSQVVVGSGQNAHVEWISDPAPYTICGLALSIGLTRQGLLEYSAKTPEFSDTVKNAKERVHARLEERLYDGKGYGPGHIFGLKNNFGWKDVQSFEPGAGAKGLIFVFAAGQNADRTENPEAN